MAFALAAAVCWAAYILLTQKVGDEVTGLQGLAVSMPVAGIVATVVAGPSVVGHLSWELLLAGLGLAVLLPVIPFSLELLALRRLTTAAFGTLMSLEPAIALVIGLVALGQVPGVAAVAGIALRGRRRHRRATSRRPPSQLVTAGAAATSISASLRPQPPGDEQDQHQDAGDGSEQTGLLPHRGLHRRHPLRHGRAHPVDLVHHGGDRVVPARSRSGRWRPGRLPRFRPAAARPGPVDGLAGVVRQLLTQTILLEQLLHLGAELLGGLLRPVHDRTVRRRWWRWRWRWGVVAGFGVLGRRGCAHGWCTSF